MFFVIIFGTAGVLAGAALFYFWRNFRKFYFVEELGKKNKILAWTVALIPELILVAAAVLKTSATVVVILHLFVIWFLSNRIASLIKKRTKREWKRNWQGVFALVFTFLYLCYGWYAAHHVIETDYAVSTDKELGVGRLRIAEIADSHIGATFDGEGFAEHMKKVEKTDPDIVVIVGDFVDDDTTREDMERACAALGELKTTYGVYYVNGNHDRGYMNYRDFSLNDLYAELKKNHVRTMEDECVELGEHIVLIGRQDKSIKSRADMELLTERIPKDKYTIVLDHQPGDYDAQAQAQVDLVLSGHTHGGWMFPMTVINRFVGIDDLVYGHETREKTDFIVTSGISDWALPFKPGTCAEFVVIDIE